MNYKDRFITATGKTKELGLNVGSNVLPFKKKFSKKKQQQILHLCANALRHHGYSTSSSLASQCTPVHLMLKSVLKENLGINSVITIGDRFWDDYIYCEMSYKSINEELSNVKQDQPIKAHVWLTLPDGTILDCTGEAHADLLFERGEHPLEQCLMYVDHLSVEDPKTGYHRPYLVGEDFLLKAGVIGMEML